MKFFGMGGLELVIILVIVLLIFGPKNLPKLGKALGRGVKGLRKGVESGKEKIDEKFEEVEVEKAETKNSASEEPQNDSVADEGKTAQVENEDDDEPEDDADAASQTNPVKVRRVVRKAPSDESEPATANDISNDA